jgi:hypothetical protein
MDFSKYILTLIFILSFFHAKSNHIISSDISYKRINELDFEFRLEFYTDLNSNDTTGVGLNIINFNQPLWQLITPPKEMILVKTDTIFGRFKKFTFLDTIRLPLNEEWIVSFKKSKLTLVSNLVSSYQFVHYNELYINTQSNLRNNSPKFIFDPIILSCAGDYTTFPMIYEEVDKSDSITFELTPVITFSGSQTSIIPFFMMNTGNSGYTVQNPINAAYFNLNTKDGTILFKSNQIGNFIFTIKVKEYKGIELVSYYTKHIFVSIKSCDNYQLPYLQEDSYQFCLNDSLKIESEIYNGNNPHINIFECNLSYSNLMVDSNKISGIMTSTSHFYVNILDSIRFEHFYNNYLKITLDVKNEPSCFVRPTDRKVTGKVLILNLFGQVIFESNETLKESISKLPNEYKGQILIWRIYSDYYDKIETGIFVKILE